MLIVGIGNIGKKFEITRHNLGFLFLKFLREKYDYCDLVNKELYESCRIDLNSNQPPFFRPSTTLNLLGGATNELLKYKKFLDLNYSQVFLLKPYTMVNLSGNAVYEFLKYKKVKKIFIVHDDIDQKFGNFKIKEKICSHNGVRDIFHKTKSLQERQNIEIYRVSVGIDRPSDKKDVSDHVLSSFNKEEILKLPKVFEKIDLEIQEYA